uniref:Uncharacterized protein n=1 Tax=Arundo donax TaxID=35708 RepID=A0A0A9DNX8_ARUDO
MQFQDNLTNCTSGLVAWHCLGPLVIILVIYCLLDNSGWTNFLTSFAEDCN